MYEGDFVDMWEPAVKNNARILFIRFALISLVP